MPFKNATSEELLSYEQVKGLPEYAGILSDDTILVDVDDMDQSMALLTIIETLGLKCRVYATSRGKHFLFKNTLADVVADDFDLEETVCDTLADEQAKTVIWEAVSDLGGNASEVVHGYYKNGETLQSISDRLEVSIERVRQIKHRAISSLRRNRKLKEAADVYGYGCAKAYYWGLGQFKNTGVSSTEYLALKHLEQEQARKQSIKEIRDISTLTRVSSRRLKQENGTVPIGLKKLAKTIEQAEALLREVDKITKGR